MKIEWLQLIAKTVESGSLSRAAERCHISQPAASRMIMSAENELNETLFIRSDHGQSITLSEAGKKLLPEIISIVNTYDNMLLKTRKKHSGIIRLGISDTLMGVGAGPKIISRLYMTNPDVVLKINMYKIHDLYTALSDGNVDVILYNWGYMKDKEPNHPFSDMPFEVNVLGDTDECLAISENSDFALSGKESVCIDELSGVEFIVSINVDERIKHGGQPFYLVDACKMHGFTPRFKYVENAPDVKHLMTIQNKGNFLSSFPKSLNDYPGLKYLPVSDCPYKVRYYTVHKKNSTIPYIDDLIKTLESFFEA